MKHGVTRPGPFYITPAACRRQTQIVDSKLHRAEKWPKGRIRPHFLDEEWGFLGYVPFYYNVHYLGLIPPPILGEEKARRDMP